MKFSTTGEKIKSKISLLDKVTSKSNQLRALQTILFQVKNGKVVLSATNLDVGAEVTISVKVEKEGEVALLSGVLNNFLSTLSNDDTITFELINTNVLISSKKSTTLIKSESTEDFPTLPRTTENKQTIPVEILTEGFKTVFFSASLSDIKPEIASVYVYSNEDFLYFVATDSFRLAEKKIHTKTTHIDSLIIPYRNVLEIIRFFEGSSGDALFSFDKNQLSISLGEIYITTRLINGVYPNYRQIIPSSFKTQVTLLKNDFGSALKKASIFLDEFNRLTLKTNQEDGFVEIDARNSNVGENTTQVEAQITGDDISMGFNHRYINDVVSHITTDSLALKFIDQTRPLVVTPIGDTTFLYLVMPVNR